MPDMMTPRPPRGTAAGACRVDLRGRAGHLVRPDFELLVGHDPKRGDPGLDLGLEAEHEVLEVLLGVLGAGGDMDRQLLDLGQDGQPAMTLSEADISW